MTWQAAMTEACRLARACPLGRFAVVGYDHNGRRLYEVRCAGRRVAK